MSQQRDTGLEIEIRKGYPCPMRRFSDCYVDITAQPRESEERQKFASLLRTIPLAQRNMTDHDIMREHYGETPEDFVGYYSVSALDVFIRSQTNTDEPSMGVPEFAFSAVIGTDVARGGERGAGNDATIISGYIPHGDTGIVRKPCVNWAWRNRMVTKEQFSGEIHRVRREQLKTVKQSIIISDLGGGGLDLRDALAKPNQLINHKYEPVHPIMMFNPNDMSVNSALVFAKKDEENKFAERVYGKPYGGNEWFPNMLHRNLAAAIEHMSFETPRLDIAALAPFEGMSKTSDIEREVDANIEHYMRDPALLARINILLALRQILNIKTKKNHEGVVIKSNDGLFTFEKLGKQNTDLAMALAFWWFGVQLLQQLHASGELEGNSEWESPVVF